MIIKTERLNVSPASDAQMKRLIAAEVVPELKAAYTEMLDGSLAHPDQREWYAIWNIEQNGEEKALVGNLSFHGWENGGIVEIGYGTNAEYEGCGYMSEAVSAVVRWAASRDGVTRIEAETAADNAASQRVLQKAGFVPDGTVGEEGPRFVFRTAVPAEAIRTEPVQ